MLLSGVIFVNLSSTKPQIIQKPETKTHKPNKPPKRVLVDFEFCDSREDIINLFKINNALKTINIQDYFLENQKLLSMVDMDDFGDFEYIYNESDIMRYAIYTQLSPKSQIQNINILNREIAKKSDYASYIYIKNSLTIKNFDSKCEQIAKAEELAKKLAIRKKRQKVNPGKKYKEPKLHKIPKPKIEKDIPL